ncbi:MAG: ergothioneine biosynthesis protein EgtB [Burkholderiales bacterium]
MNPQAAFDAIEYSRDHLRRQFADVRAHSQSLSGMLSVEDHGLQSMPDASPAKWHLAHTSWFFEALILCAHIPRYKVFDPRFFELFNSYYESLGPRHPRPQRGLLSRPDLAEVQAYRRHVNHQIEQFLENAEGSVFDRAAPLITLGLQHEQQHQELLLTDIKHAFSCNPLLPALNPITLVSNAAAPPQRWIDVPGGMVDVGHAGDGFAFDNETPRHRVWLESFRLAARPVCVGEYLEFMQEGGYRRPELWLSDGWSCVQTLKWEAPLYWRKESPEDYRLFTLHGSCALDANAPVCHLSYYEAAAFATWAGARLPTEFEWEHAAATASPVHRHELHHLHPQQTTQTGAGFQALFGEVWEWTQSAYAPYPGFRPWSGAVAEYNGKFMINQMVLRGGSCVTPPGHLRRSYRNFFPPAARWQFSGVRLARDST